MTQNVSRIEPFSAPNVFGFIALQYSFQILKEWIRNTKYRKSKTRLQKIRNDPQNEVNSTFHGLQMM